MSKAILIMDMPTKCEECQLFYNTAGIKMCEAIGRLVECKSKKPTWCPLREVPQKKEDNSVIHIERYEGYLEGWNDCVTEILGGGEKWQE